MDSLIPIFRRTRVTEASIEQYQMSDMVLQTQYLPGLLRLPLELRLEIYTYVFSGLQTSPGARPEKYMIPFDDPASGLLFGNHQLLSEAANFFYAAPRITFPRPELCFFILNTSRSLLSRLASLDITLKAYETHLLEPIFDLIHQAQSPLKNLKLALVPAYPGQVTFPIPRYVILREEFQLLPLWPGAIRQWARGCQHDHSYFQYHFKEADMSEDVMLSKSSLGKLMGLRHLTVAGQPEFSRDFEVAILKLHLGMDEVARGEGKELLWAECCGVKDDRFYFEVWIPEELPAYTVIR